MRGGGREPGPFSRDLSCPCVAVSEPKGTRGPSGAPGGRRGPQLPQGRLGCPSPPTVLSDSPRQNGRKESGQTAGKRGSPGSHTGAFSVGTPSSLVPLPTAALSSETQLGSPSPGASSQPTPRVCLWPWGPLGRQSRRMGLWATCPLAHWTVFTNWALTMRQALLACLCLPTPFYFWLNVWMGDWTDGPMDTLKGPRARLRAPEFSVPSL